MDHQETPDNNNSMLTLVLGIQIRSEDKTPYYSQDIDLHTPPQFEVGSIDCPPSATEMRDSGATFRPNVSSCCLAVMVFMLTTGVWVVFMASCFVRLKRIKTYGWHCQRYRKDLDRPLALSKKTALVKQQISEHLANTRLKENGSLQEKKASIHLGIDAPTKKSKSYDSDGEHFLHALYTRFANFRPRPAVITLFPASRRDQTQGQGSGGRDPEHRDPSPQRSARTQQPPDSIHGVPWSTFRHEMHRMGTFSNLTTTLPVSALKLAQAGFLCLPGDAIVCYFCVLRRDEWRAGESPLDVHRQLQGTCPVVNSRGSENQAENSMQEQHLQHMMTSWSVSGPSFLPDNSLGHQTTTGEVADARGAITQPLQPVHTPTAGAARAARDRCQTGDLAEDSHSATPLALAGSQASASGFTQASTSAVASQNQTRDGRYPETSAASLSAQSTGGSIGRQAGGQHQPRLGLIWGNAASANPGGPAIHPPILDGTAQPESPRSTAQTPGDVSRAGQQVVTYQQLGIVTDSPKRPDMAMVNSRLASFTNWPADHSHTPLQLTEAGFFYGGYADCGRCFFCGGGLKSWDPPDNPWVEHARWFPRCAYVRQCQGQDFIDVVQELNDGRRPISFNEVRETINQRRADGERIQEPVVDPAITSVLELGLSQETVDAAVQRLQGEGHMLTADRLYDSIKTDEATAAGGEASLPSASNTEIGEVSELVAENSEMRQQRMCKICLDKESSIVFLPCGHLVSCPECSPALMHCPMCRQRVKGRVRAFPA